MSDLFEFKDLKKEQQTKEQIIGEESLEKSHPLYKEDLRNRFEAHQGSLR